MSKFYLTHKALSGATTWGQSGPGSDDNKGELLIPQSSSITGASLSDCLVSYTGHSSGEGILPLCRDAVDVFYDVYSCVQIVRFRNTLACTSCLIRNSNTPISLAMDLIDLLGSLSIIARISPTNSRVLFLLERLKWNFRSAVPSTDLWTHSTLFQLFALSSDWHANCYIFVLELPAWMPIVKHVVSEFLLEWISSWRYFSYTDFSLQHSRKNLKQSSCTKLMI